MLRETVADRVAWLTLNRPERLNSFTVDDYAELRGALERATADDDIRVVVITGEGRAFSAGADRSLLDGTDPRIGEARPQFTTFVEVLTTFPKPLLAACNGLAVGVGATLQLHCDIVLAGRSARYRFPFTSLGVAPEAGSSVLLPARARWDDTMWALLSSEWIDAEAAQRMGLAWRIVDDDSLVDETTRVAASLAVHDTAAVAAAKALVTESRAEAVRLAVQREIAAMAALAARSPSTRPSGPHGDAETSPRSGG